MRHYLDQLLQVKAHPSAREKVELLKDFDSPTLREILFLAYSPSVVFGIGAINFSTADDSSTYPNLSSFLDLTKALLSKSLRGNAAKDAVLDYVDRFPREARELVASIFTQTLSIGCDVKRVNKAYKDCIPVFSVQLAEEYQSGKMEYPCWISPKLDGMRCVAFVTSAGVSLMSRGGKAIECMPHIEAALRLAPNGVYDGELMHPGGFQTTVSFCRTKDPKPGCESVVYHIFDFVSHQEWNDPQAPAVERFRALANLAGANLPSIKIVPHFEVANTNKLLQVHRQFVADGYEGSMLQWQGPYVAKRGWHLQKLKPFLSLEGTVVGYQLGKGKLKHLMGNLVIQDLKTGTTFGLGSGFDNEERAKPAEYWMGKVLEIQFQNYTSGKDPQPRFPTFMRERPDIDY